MKSVEVRVTGRVQGVSFRAYAARQARSLGVNGWARNEADGSVNCLFEGLDDAVDRMIEWCREGSPAAVVADVRVAESRPTGVSGFSTG